MRRAASAGPASTVSPGCGAADTSVSTRSRSSAVAPTGAARARAVVDRDERLRRRCRPRMSAVAKGSTSAACAVSAARSGARRSRATEPSTDSTAGPVMRSTSRRPPSSRRVTRSGSMNSTPTRPSACWRCSRARGTRERCPCPGRRNSRRTTPLCCAPRRGSVPLRPTRCPCRQEHRHVLPC